MATIEIKPETFRRLQSLAEPLVDTIDSVLVRLLDAYDGSPAQQNPSGAGPKIRDFNPEIPPDLTHTRVLAADFGGERLTSEEANWNGLLNTAVRHVYRNSEDYDDLRRLIIVNFILGNKTDEGYRYLSDVDVSVQGQDANSAFRAVAHIAKQLGCSLNVIFVWRPVPKAAFPGVTGQMRLAGHQISRIRPTDTQEVDSNP